jgi:hypothetical protein
LYVEFKVALYDPRMRDILRLKFFSGGKHRRIASRRVSKSGVMKKIAALMI